MLIDEISIVVHLWKVYITPQGYMPIVLPVVDTNGISQPRWYQTECLFIAMSWKSSGLNELVLHPSHLI